MAKSLKDALMNAGFRSTKLENHRDSGRGRVQKKSEIHQKTRNFCEHCQNIYPDVERYKHRNPTTEAEWICVACADKLMIDDQFRVTHQSDFAKKNMFRRYFGATKSFDEAVKGHHKKPSHSGHGNKRYHKHKKRDSS